MKTFLSEYQNDYTTYTFSYALYALKESQAEIPEIYARGFLPYTGRLDIAGDVFYLARSLRVNLSQFSESSENRRVTRLASELDIQIEICPKARFDTQAPAFREFCLHYAEERFAGGNMGEARFDYVLSREILTHILTFTSRGQVLGYLFAVLEGTILHYWYAFFDTAYLHSHALGKWMMLHTLLFAKREGLEYAYLGTCYTPKALYKVRDHRGCEFFDGMGWNGDVQLLKTLCNNDAEAVSDRDLFKVADHPLQPYFPTNLL